MTTSDQASIADGFRRDGFHLARGLFTPEEAATLRGEAHAIIDRLGRRYDPNATWRSVDAAGVDPDAVRLRHCHDAHLHSAAFTRALLDQRLVDLLALFLDGDDVQLHHNKLFVKPPREGAPFPFHQDWPFFPHHDDSLIAAIVHLDDAPADRGCLDLVAGSHLDGRRSHVGQPDWHLPQDLVDIGSVTSVPARAGDVLFFSYLTVHGSGPNTSDNARTTWLIQVRRPDDLPEIDRHRSPGQGTMLRGVNSAQPPPPTSLGGTAMA
ncbi:MAG: phytanoyl-CoA dioxygenase family protein [Actinomycetota bacterium]